MSARRTPAQHTVRVRWAWDLAILGSGDRDWAWVRESGNRTWVAIAPRTWDDKSKAVRAARAEARLTGARLVIDGEEVAV